MSVDVSSPGIGTLLPVGAVLATAPGGGLAPEDVSPGVIGFLVTLALVLACIPLFRSMTGKVRGVQHRAEPRDDVPTQDAHGDRAGGDLGTEAVTGSGTGTGSGPEDDPATSTGPGPDAG